MTTAIVLSILLLFVLVRPITTFLHELGHSLPALVFTQGPVGMVIGIPKKLNATPLVKLGRLYLWISADPRLWFGGYCTHGHTQRRWHEVLILVGGTIFSIIISVLASWWAFVFDAHGFIKVVLIVLTLSSLFDIYLNLVPRLAPIPLPDGRVTFNDGALLRWLFRPTRWEDLWQCAVGHSERREFNDAWTLYKHFLDVGWNEKSVYYNAIAALDGLSRYEEAWVLYERFRSEHDLAAPEFGLGGLVLSRLKRDAEALDEYDKALELDPRESWVLNNKGYLLNQLGRFAEAVLFFDRALVIEPEAAYPLNNRGLARIKLGDKAGGLADIELGLRNAPTNAYGYRNLGIYHFDEGRTEKALELFLRAKTMDPTTDMIEELIQQCQSSK